MTEQSLPGDPPYDNRTAGQNYPSLRKLTAEERRRLPPAPPEAGGRGSALGTFLDYLTPVRRLSRKARLAKDLGPVASYSMGPHLLVQVNTPEAIREAFVGNYRSLVRGRLEWLRLVLGNGLPVANDPEHLQIRRLVQPEFNRYRVAMYSETMTGVTIRHVQGWRDGQRLDMLEAMSALATDIIGRTLFGLEFGERLDRLVRHFHAMQAYVGGKLMSHPVLARISHRLPLPGKREFERMSAEFDEIIFTLLRERWESTRIHDDFISVMVQQQHLPSQMVDIYGMMAEQELRSRGRSTGAPSQLEARTAAAEHDVLTDQQVRDESVNMLFAGQESFHITIAWIMYHLAVNPGFQDRFHAEIDRATEGRPVDVADFTSFDFIDKLILESLRKHPPIVVLARTPIHDITVGGYLVPRGSVVGIRTAFIHNLPEHYSDPETFDPDRWTAEFKNNLDRFAYLPFGFGAHRCLGEEFVWQMMRTTLATIGQNWRVNPDPNHQPIDRLRVSAQPEGGMPLYLERRS